MNLTLPIPAVGDRVVFTRGAYALLGDDVVKVAGIEGDVIAVYYSKVRADSEPILRDRFMHFEVRWKSPEGNALTNWFDRDEFKVI